METSQGWYWKGQTGPQWPARVDATDIALAQAALDKLKHDAAANDWPVYTAVMDAQHLSGIATGVLDASVANCVLYRLPSHVAEAAACEMHRTLAPGGIAIAIGFGLVAHRAALAAAHDASRPPDAGPLVSGGMRDDASLLEGIMRADGFSDVRVHEAFAYMELTDLADWENSMWALLGKPASGWLESDEDRWDQALRVFDRVLREQPGFEVLTDEDGVQRVRLTNQAWIAVGKKAV